MTRGFARYAAFTRIAATGAPGELYGRVVFLAVVLGVFSSLWRATREAGVVVGDPRTLVWYLAGTEWILLSAPMVHVDIQETIRRGDVACQVGRPVSYVGALFAEALGQLANRAPFRAVTGFVAFFSMPFWLGRVETLARQLWDLLITFSVYPDPLFGGVLRLILFTLIPAGWVGYVPARVVREASVGPLLLLGAAAIVYVTLALTIFHLGLRRYASGSRFATFG